MGVTLAALKHLLQIQITLRKYLLLLYLYILTRSLDLIKTTQRRKPNSLSILEILKVFIILASSLSSYYLVFCLVFCIIFCLVFYITFCLAFILSCILLLYYYFFYFLYFLYLFFLLLLYLTLSIFYPILYYS